MTGAPHGADGPVVPARPDPADGRSVLLSPTDEGLERLAAARHPRENGLVDALDQWDVADIERLTELLHALSNGTTP